MNYETCIVPKSVGESIAQVSQRRKGLTLRNYSQHIWMKPRNRSFACRRSSPCLKRKRNRGQHCSGMEGVIEEGKSWKRTKRSLLRFRHHRCCLRTSDMRLLDIRLQSRWRALGLEDVVQTLSDKPEKEETSAAAKISAAAEPILANSAAEPEKRLKAKIRQRKVFAKGVEDREEGRIRYQAP